MIQRVIAASPGTAFLDVGCGTGIGAWQYLAAGVTVLGVDVDERMAQVARRTGIATVLEAVGSAIDSIGGGFTMRYVTLATAATLNSPPRNCN
jgi:predicted RNA methylase